jgi:hypothetical protein
VRFADFSRLARCGWIPCGSEFVFFNIAPRALSVLLGAAHAGGQILETVHVKATASVAGWVDSLAALKLLHPCDHLQFEWTSIVLFLWGSLGRGQQ